MLIWMSRHNETCDAGHHQERQVRDPEQARTRRQAGGRGLGRPERDSGRLTRCPAPVEGSGTAPDPSKHSASQTVTLGPYEVDRKELESPHQGRTQARPSGTSGVRAPADHGHGLTE